MTRGPVPSSGTGIGRRRADRARQGLRHEDRDAQRDRGEQRRHRIRPQHGRQARRGGGQRRQAAAEVAPSPAADRPRPARASPNGTRRPPGSTRRRRGPATRAGSARRSAHWPPARRLPRARRRRRDGAAGSPAGSRHRSSGCRGPAARRRWRWPRRGCGACSPMPAAFSAQGQGSTRPVAGSRRPLSVRAMACSRPGGRAASRSAASTASRQAAQSWRAGAKGCDRQQNKKRPASRPGHHRTAIGHGIDQIANERLSRRCPVSCATRMRCPGCAARRG